MTLHVRTTADEWNNAPAGKKSWMNVYGRNIVSVGVQTGDVEEELWVVQNFITDDGKHGYIQVYNNNSFRNTAWRPWVVEVSDQPLPEESSLRFEFGADQDD